MPGWPDINDTPEEFPLEPWAIDLRPTDAQFVREYLVDFNAMQAMLRCGFTEKNAQTNCARQIRRPPIAKAIAKAMHERAEALGITAKTVLGEAFRCYLECVKDRNWPAAGKFLEMVGRHVDVRAFRDRFAPGMGLEEDDEATDLAGRLSIEELETLARLSRKATGDPEDVEAPSTLRH